MIFARLVFTARKPVSQPGMHVVAHAGNECGEVKKYLILGNLVSRNIVNNQIKSKNDKNAKFVLSKTRSDES